MTDSEISFKLSWEQTLSQEAPRNGAEVQVLCERFWDSLEDASSDASKCIDKFTRLLATNRNKELAELVIPDLRTNSPISSNPTKRLIQARFRSLTALKGDLSDQKLHNESLELYAKEKEIIQDVDIYRAGILLFHRGSLDMREKEAVTQWLKNAPACSMTKTMD